MAKVKVNIPPGKVLIQYDGNGKYGKDVLLHDDEVPESDVAFELVDLSRLLNLIMKKHPGKLKEFIGEFVADPNNAQDIWMLGQGN